MLTEGPSFPESKAWGGKSEGPSFPESKAWDGKRKPCIYDPVDLDLDPDLHLDLDLDLDSKTFIIAGRG